MNSKPPSISISSLLIAIDDNDSSSLFASRRFRPLMLSGPIGGGEGLQPYLPVAQRDILPVELPSLRPILSSLIEALEEESWTDHSDRIHWLRYEAFEDQYLDESIQYSDSDDSSREGDYGIYGGEHHCLGLCEDEQDPFDKSEEDTDMFRDADTGNCCTGP